MTPTNSLPVLTDPQQIDKERIAHVLGCGSAQIKQIEFLPGPPTLFSLAHRIKISYLNAPTDLPATLFMKYRRPDLSVEESIGGRQEVRFYSEFLPQLPDEAALPVPLCYDAAFDADSGQWHLMLEDLSETHVTTDFPLPPTTTHCEMAIDILASVHARFWDHPHLERVGELPPPRPSASVLRERWSEVFTNLDPFLEILSDRISGRRSQLVRRVINHLPPIWEKRFAGRPKGRPGFSLVHGDAHLWNFMFPKDPGTGPAYLVDWEGYRVGTPVTDLAYMMALFWYPERRTLLERHLLHRWHERLVEGGVEDYPWKECWEDYRHSVLLTFLFPVIHWMGGVPAVVWWLGLECLFAAYEDLECGELLE